MPKITPDMMRSVLEEFGNRTIKCLEEEGIQGVIEMVIEFPKIGKNFPITFRGDKRVIFVKLYTCKKG